ncbi:hypothetical protein Poli38472_010913 [Pythium oligandrum]|uniref:Uncharacterized protein n=1 Tax=Pythium oligandrum TaxID=41045 RepID=A0A8K1CFH9_PYTOL|nr:hypothetical protein Poli38472_010913 [Pythium oligandrum]|eukprot:TMW61850.1 hypothetical protein Poli38472_010913 [Pythium oligandrum]
MATLAARVVSTRLRAAALHRITRNRFLMASSLSWPRSVSSSSSSTLVGPHFFDRVLGHAGNVALFEESTSTTGDALASWSYAQLLHEAIRLRDVIQGILPSLARADANPPRIAFLGSRGASYVVMQWATWLAGGIAVPLHSSHPLEELQYIVEDSGASVVLVSDEFLANPTLSAFAEQLKTTKSGSLSVHVHARPVPSSQSARLSDQETSVVRNWVESCQFDKVGAHIVYTSGTTGRPKGVVTTHAGLTAQIHDVVSAWEMSADDHLLHFLPLHHVHGILNNLLCVHYAGGSVEFLSSAKSPLIWSKLAESSVASVKTRPVSMLMAVPTIYMNLLEDMERVQQAKDATPPYDVKAAITEAKRLRVAISGSMACPVSILNRWEALTTHRLLERYGMTELGMALTNPLHGERHLGFVGGPFPSVHVRLVDTDTESEIDKTTEHEGELRVKGPSVFREYWGKPEATAKEFDADGWFKTGDIAQYSNEKESFRIRGRASADIIKTGGYKVSALDVERVLLTHPEIQECAVFGLPDEKWGQVVAAVVRATRSKAEDFTPPLVGFTKTHLADYRVPRKYFFVDEIPKNAMGKVNKKALAMLFAQKAKEGN